MYFLSGVACPFLKHPIHDEAVLLRKELHVSREVIFLYYFFRFQFFFLCSLFFCRFCQSLTYLHNLIQLHIANVTHRGRVPVSELFLCVALVFFCKLTFFLYSTGDAEHISEASVCSAVRDIGCRSFNLFYRLWHHHRQPEQSNDDELFTFYLVPTNTKAKVN